MNRFTFKRESNFARAFRNRYGYYLIVAFKVGVVVIALYSVINGVFARVSGGGDIYAPSTVFAVGAVLTVAPTCDISN